MKQLFVLTFFLVGIAHAEPKKSISQYGVTWTLAAPAEAGQFVTGDWWVVGPVTVQSVTPAPANDRNGSVVNPPAGAEQGYDKRFAGYDASLRAAFPLKLKPGQSLVSVASVEKIGVKTKDTVPHQYLLGPLRTAVVLTCLEKAPPKDAFRPAYVGAWKEMFTVSQLKRDLAPKLAAPKSVPKPADYERILERIWLDHQREWVNRMMHPIENMPDYGREITNIVSTVALLVLLEDPENKYETVRLRFIQKGIDYYGTVQSNSNLWTANGGHNSGRKWPILYAGLMLNHKGMMNVKASFQEDQQTYYGKGFSGQKALWSITPRNPNRKHEEVDPKTWDTYGDKKGNNGKKAEGYRKLNGPTWVGQGLAARLCGMMGEWNHPVYFDYVDRWIMEDGGPKKGFEREMWDTYRQQADKIGAEVKARRRETK
jgi:hypothetical protein